MQYYLYKKGTLHGPFDPDQLETLKRNSGLHEYHWMIDSESQIWKAICDSPVENPFLRDASTRRSRNLTAAFFHGKNTLIGEVIEMNSFGVTLRIPDQKSPLNQLSENRTFQVNLCDEAELMFVNTRASLQNQTVSGEGLTVRFHWEGMEVYL